MFCSEVWLCLSCCCPQARLHSGFSGRCRHCVCLSDVAADGIRWTDEGNRQVKDSVSPHQLLSSRSINNPKWPYQTWYLLAKIESFPAFLPWWVLCSSFCFFEGESGSNLKCVCLCCQRRLGSSPFHPTSPCHGVRWPPCDLLVIPHFDRKCRIGLARLRRRAVPDFTTRCR